MSSQYHQTILNKLFNIICFRFQTWNLEITPVEATDAGLYECRIATHPTTSNFVHLKVTG